MILICISVQCPVGTYYTDHNGTQTCTACPRGTYQDTEGSLDCIPCPDGYTTTGTGPKNRVQCKGKSHKYHCITGLTYIEEGIRVQLHKA